MKDRILLQTNLWVCLVIIVGFLMTALLGYQANYSASIESIEQVSSLTSEGIYYKINSIFSKPVNVSLTMANDSLLRDFLAKEGSHLDDPEYVATLQEYLKGYQTKYGYDSVFLVSSATARYYNFNGLDRVLIKGDPENVWYYDGLLCSDEEYSMNVDNDEVVGAENAITVFVNCKIHGENETLLGVVGVGVRIDSLQQILQDYQDKFGMNACLIDDTGMIEVSTEHTGYEQVNLFETDTIEHDNRQQILGWKEEGSAHSFWNTDGSGHKQDYIITRYLPELQWHLVVERDTDALVNELLQTAGAFGSCNRGNPCPHTVSDHPCNTAFQYADRTADASLLSGSGSRYLRKRRNSFLKIFMSWILQITGRRTMSPQPILRALAPLRDLRMIMRFAL